MAFWDAVTDDIPLVTAFIDWDTDDKLFPVREPDNPVPFRPVPVNEFPVKLFTLRLVEFRALPVRVFTGRLVWVKLLPRLVPANPLLPKLDPPKLFVPRVGPPIALLPRPDPPKVAAPRPVPPRPFPTRLLAVSSLAVRLDPIFSCRTAFCWRDTRALTLDAVWEDSELDPEPICKKTRGPWWPCIAPLADTWELGICLKLKTPKKD